MEGSKLSRVLAGGTALLFLIGGGAIEASTTHDAVASVSTKVSSGTTPEAGSVQVLASKHHKHKKKHHKHKKHHRKHKRHAKRHARAYGSIYAGTTGRWAGSVPVGSLAAVNAAYWRSYAPGLNVPTGYNGDDSRCVAGGVSGASLNATRNAVNFVRSLGGLAPVSFNSALNSRSQQTALMMSANKALSHAPSRSWRCYTSTGAANAGRSNLALAYPKITSAGVVGLYMQDPGGSNYGVGHRRWLLNPFATSMGSGSTNVANAITVIGPSSSARPNPTFVSWPSAGWFPNTIEPSGRWSLSAGNRGVSFARSTVAVYRNGHRISASKLRVENGYAQPTMAFNIPASQARSGSYAVVVRGIRAGTRVYGYTYHVSMFTPSH
jgi:uncharacterized protein YkwD